MLDKTSYLENLRTFENMLHFALDVSDVTAGMDVPSHILMANQLYTRLTLTSLSIVHLLPENNVFPTEWKLWDFFSVASLARNFIENYHMFFYIAIEDIDDEERSFRLALINYNLNTEKYNLYSDFNHQDMLKEFEDNLPDARRSIKNHPFFKKIPKDRERQILKGYDSKYLTHKEISMRIPFNTDDFIPLYKLFSNHTHSSPLAFSSMSNERGRGEENQAEVEYLTLTLEFCIKFLSATILDMTKLFPGSINKLELWKLEIVQSKFDSFNR